MRPYLFLLLLGLLVVCCTRTSETKAEDHAETVKSKDVALQEHQHAEEHAAATATTGAIDKSATSRTQDMGVIAQAADGSITVARVSRGRPLQLPPGSKIVGTVAVGPVRETGTKEHDAPSTASVTSYGAEDAGLDLRSHEAAKRVKDSKIVEKEATRWGPPWWFWALLSAAALTAIAVLWKLGKLAKWAGML